MYINLCQNYREHPENSCFCVCQFHNILMVSDKTIHMAFIIHKTLSIKPITDFPFIFTSYQNYTLDLKQIVRAIL